MSAQTQGRPGSSSDDEGGWLSPKRVKWLLVSVIVALVVIAGIALWRAAVDDAADESWDSYQALRDELEPEQDPLFDPYGNYDDQRVLYVKALEAFLDQEASEVGEALEPQVRWRIAKTLADHLLAMKGEVDPAKRAPHYEQAIAHLETIRDAHPDFPLNWSMFSTTEFPSLTRKFLTWLQSNREWEATYLPTEAAPDGSEVILVRTTRGDLRLKLYRELAPEWTEAFVTRAVAGFYDGTALFENRSSADDLDPTETWVRGASGDLRDLKAYDWEQHAERIDAESYGGGLLPAESRNRIPFTRGVVAAWHDKGTAYDHPEGLLFCAQRSPLLDYEYTPIGRLIDDASLETLDKILASPVWANDKGEVPDGNNAIDDVLQVPVIIKKVLVYDKSGALVQGSEVDHLKTKAATQANEMTLSGVVPNELVEDVPPRPVVEKVPDDEKDDGADEPEDG